MTTTTSPPDTEAPKPVIRTITIFVAIREEDFDGLDGGGDGGGAAGSLKIDQTIGEAASHLHSLQTSFHESSYIIQTLRISTNPFPEWLIPTPTSKTGDKQEWTAEYVTHIIQQRLQHLDKLLKNHGIFACSVGPGTSSSKPQSSQEQHSQSPPKILRDDEVCRLIVSTSSSLSTSLMVESCDVEAAKRASDLIYDLSKVHPLGLSNFQFCVSSCSTKPYIPFFPASYNEPLTSRDGSHNNNNKTYNFAIGLENGLLVKYLLAKCQSISNIPTIFRTGMLDAIRPIQQIAQEYQQQQQNSETKNTIEFIGIDTSLNPGLSMDGSIANAIEQLVEVDTFGSPGTVATAAALTTAIQNLSPSNDEIHLTGYCGLMLPVCEDVRLAQLASLTPSSKASSSPESSRTSLPLSIQHLLNISSVCGVGIDTVPISGLDTVTNKQRLTSLILDVVGLAERWDKPLTCRVFPVPGRHVGQTTEFQDFPHMVDCNIFELR